MKKKIVTIALIALVAIIPTVIAVISYSNASRNPVTRSSVASVEVTTPNKTVYTYSKTGDSATKDLYDMLFDMNENSKKVGSVNGDDYVCYIADYTSYNRRNTYYYYLSSNPDNVYYKDNDGEYYKVDSKYAGSFLLSSYAAQLFPQSSQPVLTVAEKTSILPIDLAWSYLSHENEFIKISGNTSTAVETVDVSGGLELSFDKEPDFIYVTLVGQDGNTAYDGLYENIDRDLFVDNTVYGVSVIAKWYESDGRAYYGEATYKYTANVLSPAVFYISGNVSKYGDFIVVSAKNIVDPALIGFASEPAVYGNDEDTRFTPTFFRYGGYYHALIPFSLATSDANRNQEKDFRMTFSYGGVYQDFTVNVKARVIQNKYVSTSAEVINSKFTTATRETFRSVMSAPFANICNDIYWLDDDNMLVQPVKGRSISVGYGIKMILENATDPANKTYWHEGVNYSVKTNDEVYACLPGKVIFVGETTMSGKTVVVDHGAGLKSLYAHLSSTSVNVGDILSKQDLIGIVGATGFVTNRALHFGLYVFDVPVRYYDSETYGIRLNEEVASALGIVYTAVDEG